MVVNQSSYPFLRNNTYYFSRRIHWICKASMVLSESSKVLKHNLTVSLCVAQLKSGSSLKPIGVPFVLSRLPKALSVLLSLKLTHHYQVVLDTPIPYTELQPNSARRLKTDSSERWIPLVGAMPIQPVLR